MPSVIAIDVGTSNSCVAVFLNGKVQIIPNKLGNRVTPSIVSFSEGKVLVGEPAMMEILSNAENTIYSSKKIIGKTFEEVSCCDLKKFPFKIVNKDGFPKYEIEQNKKKILKDPRMIIAEIIKYLKCIAEKYLKESVVDAVITIPAHFNDEQRNAVMQSTEFAGLKVVRFISEPTAAALAYGLNEKSETVKNILVFSLGGGTFDVSVLTLDDGVLETKAVGGDNDLGGENFNMKLLDYLLEEIETKLRVDVSKGKKSMNRLKQECEKAKTALSTSTSTSLRVQIFFDSIHFKSRVTTHKSLLREDQC